MVSIHEIIPFMETHEIEYVVNETPMLDEPTTFNLDDDMFNIKMANELLSSFSKKDIKKTDDYVLFRTGDSSNGYIALVDTSMNGDAPPTIDYLIKYHARPYKSLGKAVTQVALS